MDYRALIVVGIVIGLVSYFLVYKHELPEPEMVEVGPGVFKPDPSAEGKRANRENIGIVGMVVGGLLVLLPTMYGCYEIYDYFKEKNSKVTEVSVTV